MTAIDNQHARYLSGLRTQYRVMRRHMAMVGGPWNVHLGSAGLVLLWQHAEVPPGVHLPILVTGVQSMTEKTMIAHALKALKALEAPHA